MSFVFDVSNVRYKSQWEAEKYESNNRTAATLLNAGGEFRLLMPEKMSEKARLPPIAQMKFEVEVGHDSRIISLGVFFAMWNKWPDLRDFPNIKAFSSWLSRSFPSTYLGFKYLGWRMAENPNCLPNDMRILVPDDIPELFSDRPALMRAYIAHAPAPDRGNIAFYAVKYAHQHIDTRVLVLLQGTSFPQINPVSGWVSADKVYPHFVPELWNRSITWPECQEYGLARWEERRPAGVA